MTENILRRAVVSADLQVRDDGAGRVITGYAVPFDEPTTIHAPGGTYTEVFRKGSFARTISERGAQRVKVFALHNSRDLPLGRAELLREDDAGLFVELRLSATQAGDEVLALVRDGALDGMSIGFRPVRESRNATTGMVERTEVKLTEISLVSYPAYDSARVHAVRHGHDDIPATPRLARARVAQRLAHLNSLERNMTSTPNDDDRMSTATQGTLDAARAILERAETEGRDLTEAEAAQHDELVKRGSGMQDMLRRTATLRDGMTRNAGLIASVSSQEKTDKRGQYDADARLGSAPTLMLTRDQIGTLHEGYMTRAVTSVTAPQAAISDYKGLPLGTYPILRDAFRVLDLIPVEATPHSTVTYYRGTTGATNAKVTGEGGQKPLSDPVYAAVVENVRKIAHYVECSEEALTDVSSFRDMIESEALMGLLNEENFQLLSGAGGAVAGTGGTAMLGLTNAVGILTYAPVAAEARILSVAKAQGQLQAGSSFTNADSLIINPADMQLLRLYQSSANEFAAGFALGGDAQSLTVWGMKTYVTTRIAAGTALVGNLAQAARVYVREVPTVKIDPYSRSTENIVKFIVEERLALTVPRPSALLKITFNGTT